MLGLLAMSLSLVEAGAASMCDPAMPMQHEAAGVEAEGMAHDMAPHMPVAAHDSYAEGHQSLEDYETDPSRCPWMPMVRSGCGAPVVMPAVTVEFSIAEPSCAKAFQATRHLTTLHSTDPLLPPPRA